MDFLTDPSHLVGLLTLVVLEIVLGIDNLIFIAILADKLPPEKRDRARQTGLGLALFMRLGLLASMSWLINLMEPLFEVLGRGFSGRDLILLGGGFFLLWKATSEIHERLEGEPEEMEEGKGPTLGFWTVVAQILVLDAVFSIDSVVTAVGMVKELYIMMAAVVIAMACMMVASKPLTRFVNAHPTIIMLCLGFLLMVGFSLVADGLGFHIPKAYLYAAIGFSVLIESFNQVGRFNRQRWLARRMPRRQRTADAVLRLMGGRTSMSHTPMDTAVEALASGMKSGEGPLFTPTETEMIRGVLVLTDRPVRSIMTPRPDVVWIDLNDEEARLRADIAESPHARLLVSRGGIDEIQGVLHKGDLMHWQTDHRVAEDALFGAPLRPYLAIPGTTSILRAMDRFKAVPAELVAVIDEYGNLEGILTQADFLRAIIGELAPPDEGQAEIIALEDGSLRLSGGLSLYEAQDALQMDEVPEGDFSTLAGLVVDRLGRMPKPTDNVEWDGWRLSVEAMDGNRITTIHATPLPPKEEA